MFNFKNLRRCAWRCILLFQSYELLLDNEPRNQLTQRQSQIGDPIDVIKSTDLLIEGNKNIKTVRRLTLDDIGDK